MCNELRFKSDLMLFWVVAILLLPSVICALGHPKYECGEHGRFEYCIDGIPGCIVGCHCHPGYYFDTETKICEPNAKLVQDYRRLYTVDPTRIPLDAYSIDTESAPTPTTTAHPMDPQVDSIAKDTDDLGDWLYNQFFKTIESQVINETKTEKPPTRRTNTKPLNFTEPISKELMNKAGRRKVVKSRKKIKTKGRKDRKKKEDLRRKLLRISEDDSLFESSASQESSDSSDDSESSSDTSDSESSAECSSEKDKRKPDKERKEKNHGHRKILMINKKPKPPLPSFIFLPQFDTPFYPPIGLPPPVVPMYPMIPVPPVPPFPYPVPGPNDNSATTTDHKTESTTKKGEVTQKPDDNPSDDTTTSAAPAEETTKPDGGDATAATDADTAATEAETTTAAPALRKLGKKKTQLRSNKLPGNAKTKKKHKKPPVPPSVPDDPFLDVYSPQDFLMKDFDKDNNIAVRSNPDEPLGPGGDVDFKYLAQLIHKMGPNDTNNKEITKSKNLITQSRRTGNQFPMNNFYPIHNGEDFRSRRTFDGQDRNLERHDDLYYTKLGHQIASLIRNVDGNKVRYSEQGSNNLLYNMPPLPKRGPSLSNQNINQRSNIILPDHTMEHNLNPYLYNIKDTRPAAPPQPILYENYAPRSYWERSVRSLFNHFQRYPEVLDQNNDNLYNLESRLIIVASTERPLSLTELENVLTVIARAKTQLQKNTNDVVSNDTNSENFNVNLLPQHVDVKTSAQNDNVFHRLHTPIITKEIHTNSDEMDFDDEDVTNFNFSNKKPATPKIRDTPNTPAPARKQLHNVTPKKKQSSDITSKKKQLPNVTPKNKQLPKAIITHNKNEVTKFSVTPSIKERTNISLSNFALNGNKKANIMIDDMLKFEMTPTKKGMAILNLIPSLQEAIKSPLSGSENSVIKLKKEQQKQEARTLLNSVKRNLKGVLLHNFKDLQSLASKPKAEIRNYNTETPIDVRDILKLQRLTKNKIKEITNTHNHMTKVSWFSPKIAEFLSNNNGQMTQALDRKPIYKQPGFLPLRRHLILEKPLRYQLPIKTQIFHAGIRGKPSVFNHDHEGSYFSHHVNIFD